MLKEIVTYAKVASTTKTESVINAEIDQITKPFSYLTYFTLNTVADLGEGLLLSFRPNWGPKGGKKILETADEGFINKISLLKRAGLQHLTVWVLR